MRAIWASSGKLLLSGASVPSSRHGIDSSWLTRLWEGDGGHGTTLDQYGLSGVSGTLPEGYANTIDFKVGERSVGRSFQKCSSQHHNISPEPIVLVPWVLLEPLKVFLEGTGSEGESLRSTGRRIGLKPERLAESINSSLP